ncbi:MAG: hypothetical protein ABIO94_13795 [Opitutaceae bacterium]
MKRVLLYIALVLSLVSNVVLLSSHFGATASAVGPISALASKPNAPLPIAPADDGGGRANAAAWKARQPGNLRQLADALRAAGLTERMVRAIISTEIDTLFQDREIALRPPVKPPRFWQQDDTVLPFKAKLALLDLAREKRKLRDETLGPDPDAAQNLSGYDHIPPEKRERVRLISEDYAVMLESMRNEAGTLPLPTDGENLRLIEAERRRDLAALLNADELAEDERRVHPFASRIRELTQFFDATPEEFRAIFAVQGAILPMNSLLPGVGVPLPTSNAGRLAQEAEKARLNEQLKAALGEARYAEYVRAKEYEFQQLSDLIGRSGLPPNAAVEVFGVRDFVSTESNRIHDDNTLDVEQKRAALKALAGNARAQITALLGPAAAEAYARSSNRWLNPVDQGSAVIFRENGQTTRPLGSRPPPPGRFAN